MFSSKDDGSRSREVLRDILKDTQIAALQSDGSNVYMYIDNNRTTDIMIVMSTRLNELLLDEIFSLVT